MPATDREVFQYFQTDLESRITLDTLAYAAFALAKFQWMATFEKKFGTTPTEQQMERWISELPDTRLDELKSTSLVVLQAASDSFIREARLEGYKAGKDDSVVRLVELATSFWRNLPGNIAVGVVSSFAFGLLLILAALLFNKDPSPIALYQKLVPSQASGPSK